MSKKVVCITALLFANIFLLAHVVIPHHHHEDAVVCFLDTHNEDCEETHNHEQCDNQDHKHDSPAVPDKCCIIDNVYFSAHNNVKTTHRSQTNYDCGQVLYALISNSLNLQDGIDNTAIYSQENPYVPLFYTEFITRSIGLRAPPVI